MATALKYVPREADELLELRRPCLRHVELEVEMEVPGKVVGGEIVDRRAAPRQVHPEYADFVISTAEITAVVASDDDGLNDPWFDVEVLVEPEYLPDPPSHAVTVALGCGVVAATGLTVALALMS